MMNTSLRVSLYQLSHAQGLDLPTYYSPGAAGLDLQAAIPLSDPVVLEVGKRKLIETGLVLHLPKGFEGQIRPRSGLAWHHGVTVLNSPGTIDEDYGGELKVILINLGEADFKISRGDRIAQLIIAPVTSIRWEILDDNKPLKERGTGGFGSTGI